MLNVNDKWVGTMYREENVKTLGDAALYLKDFMNDDDTLVVKEIGSGCYLLHIVDSVGDVIDIFGFLHP